jgi:chromosome segregation ATPase
MTETVAYQAEDQEMSRVREIFDRALNALVDATTLAKSVEVLRTDLDGLKAQVTHYRNTIANQDDQITRLRQDRDAARTAQYHAEDQARHQATDFENMKRELESSTSANVRMNERISELSKERDDAQFKLLELSESYSALTKKLDDIRGHMQGLLGLNESKAVAKEPELVHEPISEPLEWHRGGEALVVSEPDPNAISNPPEPTPPESYPQDIR